MKKLLGSMKKSKSGGGGSGEVRSNGFRSSLAVPTGDGPDAVVYREVSAFCDSGAPGSPSTGDEYLHLPAIVDAAESSPAAANQAAVRIRGYLGKDHYDRGYAQYNAIMLARILTDNPGRIFTQNFDKEFVSTVKKLLRDGKDGSVQQILRETLDYFEVKSSENDSLLPLVEMWRKEKGNGATLVYSRHNPGGPPLPSRHHRGLPPPDELAGRIEEAKTTARLLVQTIQSTPTNELLANDLVKEFAERARVAQKSIQGYMNAENPHPDDDTMLTLIETSEQLGVAMTKHQRAVLQARKIMGGATPSPQPQENRTGYMTGGENVYGASPPPQPQRPLQQQQQQHPRQDFPSSLSPPATNGYGRSSPVNEQFVAPPGPPPNRATNNSYPNYQKQPSAHVSPTAAADHQVADNPFTDAAGYESQPPPPPQNYSLFGRGPNQAPQRPLSQSNTYGQIPADHSYSQPEPESSPPQRPTAYNQGFVPTQSYMHRQDSATAHITMHGASPPSETQR